jgi:hypothetical protein
MEPARCDFVCGGRQCFAWAEADQSGQAQHRQGAAERPGGRRQDVRTADQIAAALALIRQSDERWHGLTVWLSHSGMDRDAELLDRLAVRAARTERDDWFRAAARASRRRGS